MLPRRNKKYRARNTAVTGTSGRGDGGLPRRALEGSGAAPDEDIFSPSLKLETREGKHRAHSQRAYVTATIRTQKVHLYRSLSSILERRHDTIVSGGYYVCRPRRPMMRVSYFVRGSSARVQSRLFFPFVDCLFRQAPTYTSPHSPVHSTFHLFTSYSLSFDMR